MRFVLSLLFLLPACLPAQMVRLSTSMGDIDIQLLPESAPLTVRNFLNYVEKGAYDNSFFHRLVRSFVLQGGGYTFRNGQVAEIRPDPAVRNEFRESNTRGTIAMAKLPGDPNSATSQFFFNVVDNAARLNNIEGGFTVFARVANAQSLQVMDRIAGLQIYRLEAPFEELPLRNVTGSTVSENNLILIRSITVIDTNPAVSENGLVTATNFGGFTAAAPGSFVEIYGQNFAAAGTQRGWTQDDFSNGTAPTSLADVTVTVDGKPAYVNFVSPGQINIQVPAEVAVGGSVPVVVTANGVSTTPMMLEIRSAAGGILAPASFKVGDRQFVAATHQDGSFISNGQIPNVPPSPAKPGEMITFYGVGFGAVNPTAIPYSGQIVNGIARTVADVGFRINDIPCHTEFAGLAPGFVGLYQFNVAVPPESGSGDHRLVVLVNGAEIDQKNLYISIRRD